MSNKDEFTGQYKVISTCPITLENGQALPAGSDITKYFTMNYDGNTNTVTETATPEFIKIANLPANKKVEFGYTVYNQCKRVGYGEISDVFQEYYNGHLKNSNMVVTYTPKPVTPVIPKPETPAAVTPVIPAKKTPVPKPKPAVVKPEVKPAPAKPASKAKPVVKPQAKPVEKSVPAQGKPAVGKDTGVGVGKGLPQTGETDNGAAVGLAELAASLVALSFIKKDKREE